MKILHENLSIEMKENRRLFFEMMESLSNKEFNLMISQKIKRERERERRSI